MVLACGCEKVTQTGSDRLVFTCTKGYFPWVGDTLWAAETQPVWVHDGRLDEEKKGHRVPES